ncbi:MAG: hypothetical protein ACYS0H_03285 [Planctomycetota bacterium]|jgi:hypothetical protein
MKKYAVPIIVVLAVLAVGLSAFAQAEERARRGPGGSRRARLSPEDQQKAIKAIEGQLVKLKAATQVQIPRGGFADLSEEERTKVFAAYRDRSTALRTITAQVALLQGRRQPTEEGARFMIINTMDLKPIQEAATKEKAAETGKLIERLMARGTGRGFGRRPGGGRPGGQ